jgi:hypothetical protein
VVRWLGEWLSGQTKARYLAQVRDRLHMDDESDEPRDGTPYMEGDGTSYDTEVNP